MNSSPTAVALLKQHGLKKTPVRLTVLRLFMQHNFALSARDIESLLDDNHGQVSLDDNSLGGNPPDRVSPGGNPPDRVSPDRVSPDRVTVYRTLGSFEEKGIIHKAPDEGYGVKYALCSDHCPDGAHDEGHVHFICHTCNHTYCLEDTHIPMIKLPSSYAIEGFSYTINGVCKTCNAEALG